MNKYSKFLIFIFIFIIITPPILSYLVLNYSDLNKRNFIKQKIIQATRVPYLLTRNIWQSYCTKYDKVLLYFPKNGECQFDNLEFKTKTNFYNGRRLDNLDYNENKLNILVLGDSIAMGWGVNDNKTFPYLIENSLSVNVDNYSISSFGTIREMQLLERLNKQYDLIILQYNNNDYSENLSYFENKTAYPRPKKFFDILSQKPKSMKTLYVQYMLELYNFYYIQPIKRRIFKQKDHSKKKIDHSIILDSIFNSFIFESKIKSNIIILPINGTGKGVPNSVNNYFKKISKLENIYYLNIKFDKNKHFFKLDDHLNENGHVYTKKKVIDFIKQKKLINQEL